MIKTGSMKLYMIVFFETLWNFFFSLFKSNEHSEDSSIGLADFFCFFFQEKF